MIHLELSEKPLELGEHPNILTSFCQNIRVDSEKLSPKKNWSCYLEVAKHGGNLVESQLL